MRWLCLRLVKQVSSLHIHGTGPTATFDPSFTVLASLIRFLGHIDYEVSQAITINLRWQGLVQTAVGMKNRSYAFFVNERITTETNDNTFIFD